MVAVDTNLLVRIFTQDDLKLATKAQATIGSSKPGTVLLDRLVFAELSYVLRSVYNFDKLTVFRIFTSLLANTRFHIPNREQVELAVSLFGSEQPLSFVDCWLLALKQSGKVEKVLTFDNNLLKRL